MSASLCLAVMLSAGISPAMAARVVWVIDGDTIEVNYGGVRERVRLIGVDAPESNPSAKLYGQARRTGVARWRIRAWGRLAKDFTARGLAGRRVLLTRDPIGDRRDRHGRLLAYVILAGGRNFNQELVRAGFALAYRRYRYTEKARFIALEAQAKQARRGLWADPAFRRFVDRLGLDRRRYRRRGRAY